MLVLNNAKSLLLGTGSLVVNTPGVNVGMLKGDVQFNHEPKVGEVKGGFPQVVVKKYKEEETAVLSASMAEINKANVKLLLGGYLGGGGLDDLPVVSPVVFTHEREGDYGVIVRIWKGKVTSGFQPKFGETTVALLDFKIEAEADLTKPKGKQLYELDIYDLVHAEAESVGTGDASTKTFNLDHTGLSDMASVYVTVAGLPVTEGITVDKTAGTITFGTAPATGAAIVADYWYKVAIEE